jgi:hypothetical protein
LMEEFLLLIQSPCSLLVCSDFWPLSLGWLYMSKNVSVYSNYWHIDAHLTLRNLCFSISSLVSFFWLWFDLFEFSLSSLKMQCFVNLVYPLIKRLCFIVLFSCVFLFPWLSCGIRITKLSFSDYCDDYNIWKNIWKYYSFWWYLRLNSFPHAW